MSDPLDLTATAAPLHWNPMKRFRVAAGWMMFVAGLGAGVWAMVVLVFVNPALQETQRYLAGWDVLLVCVGGLGFGALVLALNEERRRGGRPRNP